MGCNALWVVLSRVIFGCFSGVKMFPGFGDFVGWQDGSQIVCPASAIKGISLQKVRQWWVLAGGSCPHFFWQVGQGLGWQGRKGRVVGLLRVTFCGEEI
jgi:hypothetical protein